MEEIRKDYYGSYDFNSLKIIYKDSEGRIDGVERLNELEFQDDLIKLFNKHQECLQDRYGNFGSVADFVEMVRDFIQRTVKAECKECKAPFSISIPTEFPLPEEWKSSPEYQPAKYKCPKCGFINEFKDFGKVFAEEDEENPVASERKSELDKYKQRVETSLNEFNAVANRTFDITRTPAFGALLTEYEFKEKLQKVAEDLDIKIPDEVKRVGDTTE